MKFTTVILSAALGASMLSGGAVAQSIGSAASIHLQTNSGIASVKVFSDSVDRCVTETKRSINNMQTMGYKVLGFTDCQRSFAVSPKALREFDGKPLPLPFDVINTVDHSFGPVPWPRPWPKPFPWPWPWPGPVCLSCPPPYFDVEQIVYVHDQHASQFKSLYDKFNIGSYQKQLHTLQDQFDLEGFDRAVLDLQLQILEGDNGQFDKPVIDGVR